VVGLGAVGSAVLYQLAKRNVAVLGIDRFGTPHKRGSSHGETRITRQAIGEGEAYVPLVLRSHEIWRELEAEIGADAHNRLMQPVGGLIMGEGRTHGAENFVEQTFQAARRFGIVHEELDAREIMRRFPQFLIRGNLRGYYEPGAGMLHPEACVDAQMNLARKHKADVRIETMLGLRRDGRGVAVVTGEGEHRAAHVVIAAGAWLPGLVRERFPARLLVRRQVQFWFECVRPELWSAAHSPVFMWLDRERAQMFYGFPMMPGAGAVKVASSQDRETIDPNALTPEVSEAEKRAMFATHIEGRLDGLGRTCTRAEPCLYTVSPDSGFIVTAHPDFPEVTIVSACSGHGFKHSAALGEAIAKKIVGERGEIDLAPFSAERFARV
jgi:sarcosine oxidase